jgi:hypothetical protein
MNLIGLVMAWFAIQSVYGVGLGLRTFNHFQSSFVMMFMLNPPSNKMSLIMFLPTWTYITTMWGSITTKVITKLGLDEVIVFILGASDALPSSSTDLNESLKKK